jgi:heme oxygenase
MTASAPAAISAHVHAADAKARKGFGPRVRRLHARIGAAHRQAEGMAFARSLLGGEAAPLQLAALIRSLQPAYGLIEARGPELAAALGASALPWSELARHGVLTDDMARLAAAGVPATPELPAARAWLEHLQLLARQAPHRFMAHVYVRYGGDLSGGQQLAEQANGILARSGLAPVSFWRFNAPTAELKQCLHGALERLDLSEGEEEELLAEAVDAFHATQRLLADLAAIPQADLAVMTQGDQPA